MQPEMVCYASDVRYAYKNRLLSFRSWLFEDKFLPNCSYVLPVNMRHTLCKDCVLIPMRRSDDGAHSQNEILNIPNFQNGVREPQLDSLIRLALKTTHGF